jgi:hypothetical protein
VSVRLRLIEILRTRRSYSFDGAVAWATHDGLVAIELGIRAMVPVGNGEGEVGADTESHIAERLRCSPATARHLRDVITSTLDMLDRSQDAAAAVLGKLNWKNMAPRPVAQATDLQPLALAPLSAARLLISKRSLSRLIAGGKIVAREDAHACRRRVAQSVLREPARETITPHLF